MTAKNEADFDSLAPLGLVRRMFGFKTTPAPNSNHMQLPRIIASPLGQIRVPRALSRNGVMTLHASSTHHSIDSMTRNKYCNWIRIRDARHVLSITTDRFLLYLP